MHLVHESEVPPIAIQVVRSARWVSLLALAVCIGVAAAGVYWLIAGPAIPPVAWIIAGPFALMYGLLFLLLIPAAVHAVRASFRPTNWYMKIVHDGIYAKFRSYLNYHFDQNPNASNEKTVVFIPYDEIEAIGKHVWRMDLKLFQERKTRRERYLKIYLRDTQTGWLRKAVIAERNRKAPQRGRSSLRFGDLPLKVFKDGKLYVRWPGRRAVQELERFVKVLDPFVNRTGNSGESDGMKSEPDLIVELAEHGQTLDAVMLARQTYRMSTAEAKQLVEKLP